jgi:O-antigen/teichoic acid export membrane protein
LFTDFGISQGITKFTASLLVKGETAKIAKIIKNGMLIRGIIGFAIFLVTFFLAGFFATVFHNRPELSFFIQIASFSVLFQAIFQTATYAYVGLDKTQFSAFATNIQSISKAIISLALVLAGFGVAGAVTGHVAGYIVGGIVGVSILFIMVREYAKQDNDDLTFSGSLKTLLSYGIPLYGSVLLIGFIQPYQNLVLGVYTTEAAIGNYKAAFNFVTLITTVSVPITTILLPAFSKLSEMKEKTKTFFLFANKYTSMLIVPIAVLIIAFSREIVQVIYPTFQTAAYFLSIYALLYFLVGLGYITLQSLFNGLGETRTTLKISLITFSILVPLSPFLTNVYGAVGVIIAAIAGNAAGTVYGMYVAKRNFEIKFDTRSLIKIYSNAAIAAPLPILFLRTSPLPMFFNIIAGGILYLAIYATLLPLTKTVSRYELEIISQISERIRPLAPIIKPLIKYEERMLRS